MPVKKENRVVIDTNIFISFLIGKRLKELKNHIVGFKVKLIICDQVINEIRIVTQRPKLKKYFPKKDIEDLIDLVQTIGDRYEIADELDICRDPKDNFLLELARAGKADYLVTGDSDLLLIHKFKNTTIITYKDFEQIMKAF
jgi:putative PIN family toxin of toxin-antitoxin system